MREVLLRSGTFEYPIHDDKNEENERHRDKRREQAHEAHDRRALAVYDPDQPNAYNKQ